MGHEQPMETTMSRTTETPATPRRGHAAPTGDSALDEACFLAELRLSVEGARTAAEERLAKRHTEWAERLDRVCARLA
jgi:hypothetical protein